MLSILQKINWSNICEDVISDTLSLIVISVFGVIFYKLPFVKKFRIKLGEKVELQIEKFRKLHRTNYNIIKLDILDQDKKVIPFRKDYWLNEGENIFYCRATYADGSKELYAPYWFAHSKGLKDDPFSHWGKVRYEKIIVRNIGNHERYLDLNCKVFINKPIGEDNPYNAIRLSY